MPDEPLTVVKAEPLDEDLQIVQSHVDAGKDIPHSVASRVWEFLNPVGIATGALKGAANTAIGLGELAYDYVPGVATASDALQKATSGDVLPAQPLFDQARQDVTPRTPAEQVGNTAEQIGEFFLPTGLAGKAGKVAEIAKATLLGRAQTGSNAQGLVTGAVTAALPGAGTAARAAGRLEQSAEKGIVRALAPTKEWAKVEARKIAPQMLERGVSGSRAQMLATAESRTAELGQAIGAEVSAAAARGETVAADRFRTAIDHARAALTVQDAKGAVRAIPGTETVINRLDKLDQFAQSLGADIPIDQAQHIKQVWDKIVSKAGLYGQKAGGNATDNAAAWATREGASAFRNLIATGNPTLDAINKEFAFWQGLKKVLTETEQRTQSHGGGLTSAILGASGAGAGFASGDSTSDRVQNAIIGGVVGRNLVRVLQSPYWQTKISAPFKQVLANALASGSVQKVESAVSRIVSAAPAQLRTAEAQ